MRPIHTAVLFSLCSLALFRTSEEVEELNILFVVSFGQSGFNSSGVIPAAEIALEDINNAGILPGYKLTYDRVRDSQVSLIIDNREGGGIGNTRISA